MKRTGLIVLVDQRDRVVGTQRKLYVHRHGSLHRAFSVCVFDHQGRLLLQRRADSKYHSGGLWSNTCCGHPGLGESVPAAARRRLKEEMGLCCTLDEVFNFRYRAALDHGLIENEFDHVLFGQSDRDPCPNPVEVSDWRWAALDDLSADIVAAPDRFTPWFRLMFGEVTSRVCTLDRGR